jgi:PAS domain S-box-containing protein
MNEKINFLKFFFESGQDTESLLIEKISDFFPALVFIYNVRENNVSYTNSKFTEYFGYAADANDSGITISDLVHADDVDWITKECEKLYSLHKYDSYTFTCRFKHQHENYHCFNVTGTVLSKDVNDNVTTILFIAQEILEKLKEQDSNKTMTQLFKETEELLQFGSWNWDAVSNTVTWTTGLYKILGYSEEELKGKITSDFYMSHVLPEYRESLQAVVDSSIKNKADFDYEYQIQTKTGDVKTVFTKGKLVADQGDNLKMFGITRDVTNIRNSQREQERNLRELNRSNRDLEEFAYVASHDLQEPLRKIAMFTERLKTKFGESLDPEGQLFMDRILLSTGNMRTLIDNLLEFSKTKRTSQTFAIINSEEILGEVIATLELTIEETQTTINLPTNLPSLEVVSSEMQQLFSNLIANSIKFRKADEFPLITIRTHVATNKEKDRHQLSPEKTYWVFEVQDNGIGFEEEYTERIFQIFQRLHGKAEYPGSGIGLAICKKIVDNHNGIIFAQGVPGKGATFTIMLPEKQY